MLNEVKLIGRLTKDVELRTTPAGKNVASVSLATSEKWKDQNGEWKEKTEFHNLVVWANADNFAKYLHKGSKVYVSGKLQTRSWVGQDGAKKYQTEIVVGQTIFLDDVKKKTEPEPEQYPEGSEDEIKLENIPF